METSPSAILDRRSSLTIDESLAKSLQTMPEPELRSLLQRAHTRAYHRTLELIEAEIRRREREVVR